MAAANTPFVNVTNGTKDIEHVSSGDDDHSGTRGDGGRRRRDEFPVVTAKQRLKRGHRHFDPTRRNGRLKD